MKTLDMEPGTIHYVVPTDLFELDDIVLIPRVVSSVQHRADVDVSAKFNGQTVALPLIPAPMPDVTGKVMASAVSNLGNMSIIHRFQSIEDQVEEFKWAIGDEDYYPFHEVGAAVGISKEEVARADALYLQGCRVFLVDTANGANTHTLKMVSALKGQGLFVIAGNVGSAETFAELEAAGCDAIRIGIGTGRNCETYTETGVYSPLGSLIIECLQFRTKSLIIADGGIRKPSDFVKALALGADCVMAGGIFAGCAESPGEVIIHDSKKYKRYRGAASFGVQKENGKEPIYVEGRESLSPYTGSVEEVYKRYENGLRSAMSYFNALTLKEFRANVTYGFLQK